MTRLWVQYLWVFIVSAAFALVVVALLPVLIAGDAADLVIRWAHGRLDARGPRQSRLGRGDRTGGATRPRSGS